jgi:uncharacterized membrane protein HdeD (DUF308 family)
VTEPTVPYLPLSQLARQVWWYPVVRGVIAIVLGILVMANPTASVVFLVRLVGVFLIVDGVVAIVDGVRRRGAPQGGGGFRIMAGVIGLLAGGLLVAWPEATIGFLAILLGLWAIVGGILATLSALGVRHVAGSGWGWGLFWGLVTLAFGVALVFSTGATVAVLAWIIGLYAVLSGVVLVVVGFGVRAVGRRAAELGD